MKILVCGNGPSLLDQLKDRNLNEFNKVVRINNWQPIEGYDNRCDAWVLYPPHHLGEFEGFYDIKEHAKYTKDFWIAHEFTVPIFQKLFNKMPNYILLDIRKKDLFNKTGFYAPRTGILALVMAMYMTSNVWLAGFDFYQTENDYYYMKGKASHNPADVKIHPHPLLEKLWVDEKIEQGFLNILNPL